MITFKDCWKILQNGGPVRLYDEVRENILFDLVHGTETQQIKGDRLSAHPYAASFTRPVEDCLAYLKSNIGAGDYAFYDLGCGKGKVLLLAAMSGLFRDITGIEIDGELAEIARGNLAKRPISASATVITGNAGAHKTFAGQSVIFLYNPFDAVVFADVLANIEASQMRQAYLVYFDPKHEALVDGWSVCHQFRWRHDENRTLKIYQRRFSS